MHLARFPRVRFAHLPTPLEPMKLVGRAIEIKERKVIVETELSVDGVVTAKGSAVLVRIREE